MTHGEHLVALAEGAALAASVDLLEAITRDEQNGPGCAHRRRRTSRAGVDPLEAITQGEQNGPRRTAAGDY